MIGVCEASSDEEASSVEEASPDEEASSDEVATPDAVGSPAMWRRRLMEESSEDERWVRARVVRAREHRRVVV